MVNGGVGVECKLRQEHGSRYYRDPEITLLQPACKLHLLRTTNRYGSRRQNCHVRSSPPSPVVPVPCALSPFVILCSYPGQAVRINVNDLNWMNCGLYGVLAVAGGGGFLASRGTSLLHSRQYKDHGHMTIRTITCRAIHSAM